MDRRKFLQNISLGTAGFLGATVCGTSGLMSCSSGKDSHRPNVILIMADDMGISDIGSYGGEIQTPNLDHLAENGIKFTQFYNGARCCPTRASLLTGLHPHQAGIGHMTNDFGHDSYRGDLNNRCVTIAEVLAESGYSTWMSGKWHVTKHIGHWTGQQELTSKHNWPVQRGFDQFFGTILGAGSYYNPNTLVRNNDPIEVEEDFYYTDAINDEAVRFINDHFESDKNDQPFFGYVSHVAPHWPLHALEEDITKYKGQYSEGWDILRNERMQRMIDLELIDQQWNLTKRDPRVPKWEEVDMDHRKWRERQMEIYAAQIDRMDQGIGRIIQALENKDQLENTLILFLADNGGCAEILTEEWSGPYIPTKTRTGEPVILGNKPSVEPGAPNTFQSYGIGWANASDTPFRLYKHYVHEGGIASPLIAHWPSRIKTKDKWRTYPSYMIDIMATIVDICQAEYPKEYKGESIQPMEGHSLDSVFTEDRPMREDSMFWEHEGNRAVRMKNWKLVQRHNHQWELFDMIEDRTETNNLVNSHPELFDELKKQYQNWADRIDVLPWPAQNNLPDSK